MNFSKNDVRNSNLHLNFSRCKVDQNRLFWLVTLEMLHNHIAVLNVFIKIHTCISLLVTKIINVTRNAYKFEENNNPIHSMYHFTYKPTIIQIQLYRKVGKIQLNPFAKEYPPLTEKEYNRYLC